jgi:hypothetical protein
MKKAAARIKIDQLLETAGWRFLPNSADPANIRLESGVTLRPQSLDALGDNCATNPVGCTSDFKAVPAKRRVLLPEYIEDYVPLSQFSA